MYILNEVKLTYKLKKHDKKHKSCFQFLNHSQYSEILLFLSDYNPKILNNFVYYILENICKNFSHMRNEKCIQIEFHRTIRVPKNDKEIKERVAI